MNVKADRFTFRKSERLCGKKTIEEVYSKGTSKLVFPFRLIWKISESNEDLAPCRILISVPKRNFRRANQRNLIKRRIRESYRLSKHELYDILKIKQVNLDIALLFISKKELSFEAIHLAMQNVIRAFDKEISQASNENQQ